MNNIIEQFENEFKFLGYESLEINNKIYPYYFKKQNYLINIIDPNIINESCQKPKDLYKEKKVLEDNNIRSIFIYIPELKKNWNIYSDKFKHELSIFNKVVYARACKIKEVPNKDYTAFMKAYHLQGVAGATIKLGLYYKDELVSIMSFCQPRYNKHYQYEMSRFCSKIGWKIVGGASRLYQHFIKDYNVTSCLSYSDMMLGDGNFYTQIGMKRGPDIDAGFMWYYPVTDLLYNRRGFWKSTLPDKLAKFDPNMSAHNNMRANGYIKVFTTGNNMFWWTKDGIMPTENK